MQISTFFSGPDCDEREDICVPNPCLPPHVCYENSNKNQLSYRCDCPEGFIGPECDEEIQEKPNCVDGYCPGKYKFFQSFLVFG